MWHSSFKQSTMDENLGDLQYFFNLFILIGGKLQYCDGF